MNKFKFLSKIKDFLSRNNKKIKIGLFSSLAVGLTAFAITNSISNVNASSGINVDNGYRNISLSSNITSSSQYTKVSNLDTTDKAIYNYLANNQIYVNNNYTIDSSKKDICYWRQDNDYGRVTNIQKYKIFDEVPVNTYWEVSIQFRNSYTSSATTTLNNNVLQYDSTSTTYFSNENPNYGYSILFYYLNEDGSINPIEGYGLKLAGSPKLTYCNTQQHTFYRFYEKNLYVAINIGLSTIYNVGYEDITSSIQLTLIPYSYDSSFNNVNYNIDYYNNIQEQVETLYNENETNNATIESLNNQITALNSQIETLNNQITALNSQIETLYNENETNNATIESLNNQITALNSQIETLNDQITTLQKSYDNLNLQYQFALQSENNLLNSPFYNATYYFVGATQGSNWEHFSYDSLFSLISPNGTNFISIDKWSKNKYSDYTIYQCQLSEFGIGDGVNDNFYLFKFDKTFFNELMNLNENNITFDNITFDMWNKFLSDIGNETFNGAGRLFGQYFPYVNYLTINFDNSFSSNLVSFNQISISSYDLVTTSVGNLSSNYFGSIDAKNTSRGGLYSFGNYGVSCDTIITYQPSEISLSNYEDFVELKGYKLIFNESISKAIYSNNYEITSLNKQLQNLRDELSESELKYQSLLSKYNDLSNSKFSFSDLFISVGQTPIEILKGIFNFELMGVNVFGVVTAIITLLIIAWLLHKLLK